MNQVCIPSPRRFSRSFFPFPPTVGGVGIFSAMAEHPSSSALDCRVPERKTFLSSGHEAYYFLFIASSFLQTISGLRHTLFSDIRNWSSPLSRTFNLRPTSFFRSVLGSCTSERGALFFLPTLRLKDKHLSRKQSPLTAVCPSTAFLPPPTARSRKTCI